MYSNQKILAYLSFFKEELKDRGINWNILTTMPKTWPYVEKKEKIIQEQVPVPIRFDKRYQYLDYGSYYQYFDPYNPSYYGTVNKFKIIEKKRVIFQPLNQKYKPTLKDLALPELRPINFVHENIPNYSMNQKSYEHTWYHPDHVDKFEDVYQSLVDMAMKKKIKPQMNPGRILENAKTDWNKYISGLTGINDFDKFIFDFHLSIKIDDKFAFIDGENILHWHKNVWMNIKPNKPKLYTNMNNPNGSINDNITRIIFPNIAILKYCQTKEINKIIVFNKSDQNPFIKTINDLLNNIKKSLRLNNVKYEYIINSDFLDYLKGIDFIFIKSKNISSYIPHFRNDTDYGTPKPSNKPFFGIDDAVLLKMFSRILKKKFGDFKPGVLDTRKSIDLTNIKVISNDTRMLNEFIDAGKNYTVFDYDIILNIIRFKYSPTNPFIKKQRDTKIYKLEPEVIYSYDSDMNKINQVIISFNSREQVNIRELKDAYSGDTIGLYKRNNTGKVIKVIVDQNKEKIIKDLKGIKNGKRINIDGYFYEDTFERLGKALIQNIKANKKINLSTKKISNIVPLIYKKGWYNKSDIANAKIRNNRGQAIKGIKGLKHDGTIYNNINKFHIGSIRSLPSKQPVNKVKAKTLDGTDYNDLDTKIFDEQDLKKNKYNKMFKKYMKYKMKYLNLKSNL